MGSLQRRRALVAEPGPKQAQAGDSRPGEQEKSISVSGDQVVVVSEGPEAAAVAAVVAVAAGNHFAARSASFYAHRNRRTLRRAASGSSILVRRPPRAPMERSKWSIEAVGQADARPVQFAAAASNDGPRPVAGADPEQETNRKLPAEANLRLPEETTRAAAIMTRPRRAPHELRSRQNTASTVSGGSGATISSEASGGGGGGCEAAADWKRNEQRQPVLGQSKAAGRRYINMRSVSNYSASNQTTQATSSNNITNSSTISLHNNSNLAANSRLSRQIIQIRLARMSFYLILLWLVSWTPIASLAMINSVSSCYRTSATAVFIANTMTKLGPAFDVFIYGISHPKIKSKFKQIIKWLLTFGRTNESEHLSGSACGSMNQQAAGWFQRLGGQPIRPASTFQLSGLGERRVSASARPARLALGRRAQNKPAK